MTSAPGALPGELATPTCAAITRITVPTRATWVGLGVDVGVGVAVGVGAELTRGIGVAVAVGRGVDVGTTVGPHAVSRRMTRTVTIGTDLPATLPFW
jgi:hypothetical protein